MSFTTRDAIAAVVDGRSLTEEQAAAVMEELMAGEATPAQAAALLTALRMRGESVEEIAGFVRVMRRKVARVEVDLPVVDTCGTGGDGKGTFNVSTTAAFVVAGAGQAVAKHGNRAASSACGSADLLEALGVHITLTPAQVAACLERVGLGFMFAPAFHPSMRFVAPVRREIGIRTVFNILGPLTNPAGARTQLLGVGDPAAAAKIAEALGHLGCDRAMVVHSRDGLDELSLGAPTDVWEVRGHQVTAYVLDPRELGFPAVSLEAIKGGDAQRCAAITRAVLEGERGPARDVTVLNAGAALLVAGRADDLRAGCALAAQAIDDGRARAKLDQFLAITQSFAGGAGSAL